MEEDKSDEIEVVAITSDNDLESIYSEQQEEEEEEYEYIIEKEEKCAEEKLYHEPQTVQEQLLVANETQEDEHITLDILLTYLPKFDTKTDPVIGDWVLIIPMRRAALLDPLIEKWERAPCVLHEVKKGKRKRNYKRRKRVKMNEPTREELTMLSRTSLAPTFSFLEQEEEEEEEEMQQQQEQQQEQENWLQNKLSHSSSMFVESDLHMCDVRLAPLSIIRAHYCKRQRQSLKSCHTTYNQRLSRLLYLHIRTGLLTPTAPPCFGGKGNYVETLVEVVESKTKKRKIAEELQEHVTTNTSQKKNNDAGQFKNECVVEREETDDKIRYAQNNYQKSAKRYKCVWISLTHDNIVRRSIRNSSNNISNYCSRSMNEKKAVMEDETFANTQDGVKHSKLNLSTWIQEIESEAESEWEEWQETQQRIWEKSYEPRTIHKVDLCNKVNNHSVNVMVSNNSNNDNNNILVVTQNDVVIEVEKDDREESYKNKKRSSSKVNALEVHGTPYIKAIFPHSM